MKLGVDLSTYLEEKAFGAKWYLDGTEVDPLEAFRRNGVDYLRLRVWNNPYGKSGSPFLGGTSDRGKLLELALKGKELGYAIVVDFHYSDFWCDPAKQFLPRAWEGLDMEGVKAALRKFTAETLLSLKDVGVEVHGVQIGNEITNGFLWPLAKLNGTVPNRTGYEALAEFLKEGASAVKSVYPDARVILHLENSGNRPILDEWFSRISELGVPYDVIGLSYYPYWHGSMANFFENATYLKCKFKKEVAVMETGFAFTLADYESGAKAPQLVVNEEVAAKMKESLPYECTKEGQRLYVHDFLERSREAGVSEVYYWEPAWIPVKGAGWASLEGQAYVRQAEIKETRNEWANQILFDYEGEATPAFGEFKNN